MSKIKRHGINSEISEYCHKMKTLYTSLQPQVKIKFIKTPKIHTCIRNRWRRNIHPSKSSPQQLYCKNVSPDSSKSFNTSRSGNALTTTLI